MKPGRGKLRSVATKIGLLLVSTSVGLAIVELSLRAFYPRHQYAAESSFERNPDRIWVRQSDTSYERLHPDSQEPHRVRHNNLALRHQRDISESDLASAVNVGVFGDSFAENLRLPGQYGFVEVLDYLLNRHAGEFNVLNLGVDGYGTDQAYVQYREFDHSGQLDHVLYLFCVNDIRNIYENGLYTFDPQHGLTANEPPPSAWWVSALGQLHTTYVVLEALQRTRGGDARNALEPEAYFRREEMRRARDERFHDERAAAMHRALRQGGESAELDEAIAVFRGLLTSWKESVEAQGGKFHVVLLPRRKEHEARELIPRTIDVIDLYEEFSARVDDYDYDDWRFANDAHWDEAGNRMAATTLLRALETRAGLAPLAESDLVRAVYTYYRCFEGWMPGAPFGMGGAVDPANVRAIRERYGPPTTE